MRIFLIRHGKPNYNFKAKFTANEMINQLQAFNQSGIIVTDDDKEKIERIKSFVSENSPVFTSELKRSIETALLLFPRDKIETNAIFNEFDLEILKINRIKLSFNTWLIISRILWFTGFFKKRVESYQEAYKRAEHCVEILAENASKNSDIFLFGHGLINSAIGRILRKKKWEIEKRSGNGYLKVLFYSKS